MTTTSPRTCARRFWRSGEQMPNVVVIQGDANETLFSGRLMRLGLVRE